MAESSRFHTTNNTGDGPSAGYSAANFQQFIRESFTTNPAAEGVLYGIGNNLAATGSSSPVSVNTGAAINYGVYYTNDASVSVSITTPASNPRIDRIVLRYSWAAQTVRITRIAGTEAASPTAPALTQVANTTWDIPLYQVRITTGGVITLTDERTYIKHPGVYGWLNAAMTVNDTITSSKSNSGGLNEIAVVNTSNTAGSYARLDVKVGGGAADDPLLVYEIPGGNAWAAGVDNSDGDKYKIAPYSTVGSGDALTLTQAGALAVPGSVSAPYVYIDASFLSQVSGGNALINFDTNDWLMYDRPNNIYCFYVGGVLRATIDANGFNASNLGTGTVPLARLSGITTAQLATDAVDDTIVGNRVPQLYRRQGGSATDWSIGGTTAYAPTMVRMQTGVTITSGAGTATVTFPVAFSQPPLVFVQAFGVWSAVTSVNALGFSVYTTNAGGAANVGFYWLAIGPE